MRLPFVAQTHFQAVFARVVQHEQAGLTAHQGQKKTGAAAFVSQPQFARNQGLGAVGRGHGGRAQPAAQKTPGQPGPESQGQKKGVFPHNKNSSLKNVVSIAIIIGIGRACKTLPIPLTKVLYMDFDASANIIKVFRPAVRSVWFLFLGAALGPAIMHLGRDPEGHPAKWIGLCLLCLALIIHRLSLKYTLTERQLMVESWWGLGREEIITLAHIRDVTAAQGIAGRLAGCGHLYVASDAFNESGVNLLGQPNFRELAEELKILAQRARMGGANGLV
ncbi:hypothetical protein C4J81_09540 [Deltaproteobacteria bacterium Smac51]|nr:hypothetical protein C4J81_09540 [Deltaproteobacteria bacterium Smac51]